MKHTPGPWTVVDESIRKRPAIYAGDVPIADVRTSHEQYTAANAYLISAAPDLLEMTKAFLSYLEGAILDDRRRAICASDARAAINKAMG